MQYQNCHKAIFLDRPNRFIAHCLLNGKEVVAHVKNTGRCRELLVPGYEVYLEKSRNPARKTLYSLVSVNKGGRIVNMDSQAPNQVFFEGLSTGALCLQGLGKVIQIRREVQFEDSRFDFYIEAEKIEAGGRVAYQKVFAEVKGVTLEQDGVVLFPDAPTQRGVKHLHSLCGAVKQGYLAYAVFIVQMKNVLYFTSNAATHREFADVLKTAKEQGVILQAFDCITEPDRLEPGDRVEIRL